MKHNSRKLTLKLHNPYPKRKDPGSFTLPCFINNVCFDISLVDLGSVLVPSIEENRVTRPKKYSELSATEATQADYDIKATNIILQGLPPEVYALVSNQCGLLALNFCFLYCVELHLHFQGISNGVPKMKGLFSFSLISKTTKSTGPFVSKFHVSGVGDDIHIRSLINEGVHVLKPLMQQGPEDNIGRELSTSTTSFSSAFFISLFLASLFLSVSFTGISISVTVGFKVLSSVSSVLSLISSSPLAREIEFTFLVTGNLLSSLINTFLGSASREFLEKSKHFSHAVVNLPPLLENGVLKSFHSFGVRCHVVPYSSLKSSSQCLGLRAWTYTFTESKGIHLGCDTLWLCGWAWI
ncbi:hypothetical protein Tco_1483425 [Tanacetum coccineum]